jgi:hypothetical protein
LIAIITEEWPGGEVANTAVCKTAIRGCNSRPGLKNMSPRKIFALSLIAAGIGILTGLIVVSLWRARTPTAGLKISTTPGAIVFVDSVQQGTTPLDKNFFSGDVNVLLIPDSTSSAVSPFKTTVRLSDRTYTVIRHDFGLTDSASSGDIITLEPTTNQTAGVSITSLGQTPFSVTLDGQPQGFTPQTIYPLPVGDHVLDISAPGYSPRTVPFKAVSGFRTLIEAQLAGSNQTALPVAPATSPTPTPTSISKPYVVIKDTPTGFLRVRSAPSSSASEVGQVKPNSTLHLLQETSGWYLIQADLSSTTSGWISASYAQKFN